MMSWIRNVIGTATIAAALAAPAAGQAHPVSLFVRSGGYNALTDLDDAGTADFKKVGFNVGGGVGVELSRHFALRGEFTYARNQLRTNGAATGDKLDRFYYDAAVQAQIPTASGLSPYAFLGGGGVTLHPAGADGQSKTKGSGTAGLGLGYTVPGSGLGLFIEGQGWLFDASDLTGVLASYDKTQFELAWSGGFSYRFPR